MRVFRLLLPAALATGACLATAASAQVVAPRPMRTIAAQPVQPYPRMRVMPAGARLFWRTGDIPLTGNYQADPGPAQAPYTFHWDVGRIPGATAVRWQVSTRPFPAFRVGAPANLDPEGLVAQGDADGARGRIEGDFKQLLRKLPPAQRRPANLFLRVLPLAAAGTGTIVGQPSNVIRVYYAATIPEPGGAPLKLPNVAPANPGLYRLRLVSFSAPDFFDPNRWGCVVVTGNPRGALVRYPVGKVVCPDDYHGRGNQITSVGGFFVWAADGIVSGFDWVSGAYNGLKAAVVKAVLDTTHACDLIGLAGSGADDACHKAANIAADAGMMALGIPPSLPNFNQLVDQGVDGAVAFAGDALSSQTGVPCGSACRGLLRKGFDAAAARLKAAVFAPGCVGAEEAHQHGREPLCLPGAITKPAPHSIDVPPVAYVEITRLYPADGPEPACSLTGDIEFVNRFPGGTIYGPAGTYREVRAQPIAGRLYAKPSFAIPAMGAGQKLVVPLVFGREITHEFEWTHELWSRSQIASPDASRTRGPDWLQLFSGARRPA